MAKARSRRRFSGIRRTSSSSTAQRSCSRSSWRRHAATGHTAVEYGVRRWPAACRLVCWHEQTHAQTMQLRVRVDRRCRRRRSSRRPRTPVSRDMGRSRHAAHRRVTAARRGGFGLGCLALAPAPSARPVLPPYSRKTVRLLARRFSTQGSAELHEQTFRRLVGAPRVVVLHNLKEGVPTPDVCEPRLNPRYRDVLAHYGVVALPCLSSPRRAAPR
jgi:hypothetical protein